MIKKSLAQELRLSLTRTILNLSYFTNQSFFLSSFLHNFIVNLRVVSVLLSLLLKGCSVARLVGIVPVSFQCALPFARLLFARQFEDRLCSSPLDFFQLLSSRQLPSVSRALVEARFFDSARFCQLSDWITIPFEDPCDSWMRDKDYTVFSARSIHLVPCEEQVEEEVVHPTPVPSFVRLLNRRSCQYRFSVRYWSLIFDRFVFPNHEFCWIVWDSDTVKLNALSTTIEPFTDRFDKMPEIWYQQQNFSYIRRTIDRLAFIYIASQK